MIVTRPTGLPVKAQTWSLQYIFMDVVNVISVKPGLTKVCVAFTELFHVQTILGNSHSSIYSSNRGVFSSY